MSLFNKSKKLSEVVTEFPEQQSYLLAVIFDNLLYKNLPNFNSSIELTEEEDELVFFIAQSINYMFALKPENLTDAQLKLLKEIMPLIKSKSREAMEDDKDLRRAVVYTLRMRLQINSIIDGVDWIDTPEGKRVWDILQQYGGEFPETVDDVKYRKYLKQIILSDNINRRDREKKQQKSA